MLPYGVLHVVGRIEFLHVVSQILKGVGGNFFPSFNRSEGSNELNVSFLKILVLASYLAVSREQFC